MVVGTERAWCDGLCLYFCFLLGAEISPHIHMPFFAYRLILKPVFKGLVFICAQADGPIPTLMCSNYMCRLRVDWLPACLTPRPGLWGRGQLPPPCGSVLGEGAELTGTTKRSVGLGS